MEESSSTDGVPELKELKELEVKVGRKTPDVLLRWMRQDAATNRAEPSKQNRPENGEHAQHSLEQKISRLRLDMAQLRSADVRILQQLLVLHEGIESARWLLEDRGPLTSHCSSLTGSQYSLGGSWSSLHETPDRLDNMSVGSYLDTLADELDESSGAESVLSSKIRASNEDARVPAGRNPSPKGKSYQNGKLEAESCKMSEKVHTEPDAHWHWVQSQDDVTFL